MNNENKKLNKLVKNRPHREHIEHGFGVYRTKSDFFHCMLCDFPAKKNSYKRICEKNGKFSGYRRLSPAVFQWSKFVSTKNHRFFETFKR